MEHPAKGAKSIVSDDSQFSISILPPQSDTSEEACRVRDEVFTYMQKHFRHDEPITRALGATEEDTHDFYTDLCAQGFKGPYSLVARWRDTGELVGVALNQLCEMAGEENSQSACGGGNEGGGLALAHSNGLEGATNADALEINDHLVGRQQLKQVEFGKEIAQGPYKLANANRLLVFIEHIEDGLLAYCTTASSSSPRRSPPATMTTTRREERKMSGHHPLSSFRLFKLDVLGVKATFHGRGLGARLVAESLEIARRQGCEWVATCATARASNYIFTKFGFTTVKTVRFDEFLENSRRVYSSLHDNGEGGHLMIMRLSTTSAEGAGSPGPQ